MKSYIYILTNKNNSVLYIGVTNNLQRRLFEHKNKLIDGFSKKYNLDKCIYYEFFENMIQAIEREKYLKGKKRDFKISLIEQYNPLWEDLSDTLYGE